MAVAIVNQDVTHADGNSFTAGAGSNRLLVFVGASVDTNQMPTGGSGTFGGVALAEAVDVAWDGGVRKGIVRGYYLLEASIPAGAQVSAFTGDTTLETPYEGSVLTLSGVDQTTPIPATGVATITLDDVADTLNFSAPAGIAFLVSQHLGTTMSDPAGWTLLSTYAPMADGTQLKTWQRAFATADPAASVTLTGGGAQDGRASVFCVAEAAGGGITLTVDDAAHGHTAESPALTQANVIAANDATHGHTADSPTLTQAHVLTPADATHAHAADNLTLSEAASLAVSDALHGHTADTPALVQAHILAVQDALHAHGVDSITLSVGDLLDVADALHAHGADNVVLTQAGVLVVADALHSHSADNLALLQAHVLAVADALHGHLADELELVTADALQVDDALHVHTADSITLTQAHVLVVSDALHAHLADQISLQVPGFVNAPGRVFVVEARNRTFEAEPRSRIFVVTRGNRTFQA